MDYAKTAKEVLEKAGGRENIVSAAHCATRLRLVLRDNAACDVTGIEQVDGVKGVFSNAGQLQIIFGTGTVNKVFDEFTALAGVEAATKEEIKQAAAAQMSLPRRMVKALGDVFIPILPAIVASGLLMGLLEGSTRIWPQLAESGTYTIFHLFSNAAFVFLPVLIAASAARVFGGNIFLGAVIGMIMIHPDLLNAWNVATSEAIPQASAWFGLYNVNLVGYQGHVIPVIIAVWLMSRIERFLHKIVPEMIDLFVTPLVTVLTTGYLTLTVIGPIFSTAENWVLDAIGWIIRLPLGLGSLVMGALYAPTVVLGLHHMFNIIEAGMLSSSGLNTWMPIASAANFAQGAAALALALRTRDKKLKSLALPSSLSAFLGITEPAIFGVNLRFFKCFIAGMAGGAVGAAAGAILQIGATAYGVTGVFGFLIAADYPWQYAVMLGISFITAFGVSWILFRDQTEPAFYAEKNKLYMPAEGRVIPAREIADDTFAGGVLGEGIGIIPTTGEIRAPAGGVISSVFDTNHAVGLSADNGAEVLIHAGINTVELNGRYFHSYVSPGQRVEAGQLLLKMDPRGVRRAGYDPTVAVVVTNPEELNGLRFTDAGEGGMMSEMAALGDSDDGGAV